MKSAPVLQVIGSANGRLVERRHLSQRQQRSSRLLGIAQLTVAVIYGDFKQRFSPQKVVLAEIKTLGEYLLLKRIQADLSQPELALKTGFTVRKIKTWEHDRAVPNAAEWELLNPVLSLRDAMRPIIG